MKTIKNILSITLMMAIVVLSSCKKDADPAPTLSEIQQRLIDLQNGGSNWVVGPSGISKDGYDVTDQFTGFVLSLGENVYSTTNSLTPVWEASGTWTFQNDNPNIIARGDGVVITILLGTNSLDLTFTAEGSTGGRINAVSGEYQFHLISE